MMRNHPEQNIAFALHKDSPDWSRLEKDGFKLIDISSLRYLCAYLNCTWLISSSRTSYIAKHYWRRWHANIVQHKFCFLQHGIALDYFPRFSNPRSDLMICTTRDEYDSFAVDARFPYVYSKMETCLSGLPRHDELLHKAEANPYPKNILIMPTWRHALAGKQTKDGQFRYAEGFTSTLFFQRWQAVLQSPELLSTVRGCDYTVCFYPHPHLLPQLHLFQLQNIMLVPKSGTGIQDTLNNTALLITDYSSIAAEIAPLRRPVLYFHFDRASFFNNSFHRGRSTGYFNYERDGFGEVVTQIEDLHARASDYMRDGCMMKALYRKRAEEFFAFSDQENCTRVYNALHAHSGDGDEQLGL